MTSYIVYIFELPRSRARVTYRHALNLRSGNFPHKTESFMHGYVMQLFFSLKMGVVERFPDVLPGSAGALSLRHGGKKTLLAELIFCVRQPSAGAVP